LVSCHLKVLCCNLLLQVWQETKSVANATICTQMIVEPEQRVPDFIKAGADIVSVHCENASTIHLHRTVNQASTWIPYGDLWVYCYVTYPSSLWG
jgi:hypothetical protein